jgi:diketogulonate reductase-like aldo/keto reductase
LKAGYRLIDTAQAYSNEAEVGNAINKSVIKREDIFLTTKAQTSGYREAKKGIDESLIRAQQDYFDLMIIHWPMSDSLGTYQALEEAYQAGKLRSIGLSNFNHARRIRYT